MMSIFPSTRKPKPIFSNLKNVNLECVHIAPELSAVFDEHSWSRRGSTETILSIQGVETDIARDTSDTEAVDSDVEYEPVTESEEDGPVDGDSTECSDSDLIKTKVIEVSAVRETDFVFADSERTDSQGSDSEMDFHDYWHCAQCRAENNNPLYRYCQKCFTVRKNFFPPRPRRKTKRLKGIDTSISGSQPLSQYSSISSQPLSQDSGVDSPPSQDLLSQDQDLQDPSGTSNLYKMACSVDAPSLKDLPKVAVDLKSQLEGFNTSCLRDVDTNEKIVLPSAQDVATEKTQKSLFDGIEKFDATQLKHTETQEKNPLPDKDVVAAEKAHQNLLDGVEQFDKTQMKHATTEEKNSLPPKEAIEAEKEKNNFLNGIENFDPTKLKHTETCEKNPLPTKDVIEAEKTA